MSCEASGWFNLVKTAVYGADANWGRIIGAVGQTTAYLNPETVDVSIGTIEMLKYSEPVAIFRRNCTSIFTRRFYSNFC